MLKVESIRSRFPALASEALFFDNPGGTQVAQEVVERMQHYLLHTNANHGGVFHTSRESDAVVAEAGQGMVEFVNVIRAGEIIFGENMASFTLPISPSLGALLKP